MVATKVEPAKSDEKQKQPAPAAKSEKRGRDEALSDYLASLGGIPLFTAEEEIEYAKNLFDTEVATWEALLGVEVVLDWILVAEDESKRAFEPEAQKAILRHQKRFKKASVVKETPRVKKDIRLIAEALRTFDDDRTLIEDVVERLSTFGEDKTAAAAKHRIASHAAARVLRKKAKDIRNRFVNANLRLVVSVARRFHHYRMPLIDLIQEGNLGLIKSVHRFDHRRGFRFSTYAHWWIRQAIERAIMNKGAQVRLPVHIFDARREVAKATRELAQMTGRDPTIEEIADLLSQPVEKIEEIRRAVPREPVSLDEPIGGEEDRTVSETIADRKNPLPDQAVVDVDQASHVRRILKYLSPMEVDIIERRFGLVGDQDETLEQIGKSYSLSRERVRQIQVQGLKKMLRFCERRRVAV